MAMALSRRAAIADRLVTLAAFEAAVHVVAVRRDVTADAVRQASALSERNRRRRVDGTGLFVASADVPPRAEAIYLTHVVFRRPLRSIGRAIGMSPPGVLKAVARVEDAREDRARDAALDELEMELMG